MFDRCDAKFNIAIVTMTLQRHHLALQRYNLALQC